MRRTRTLLLSLSLAVLAACGDRQDDDDDDSTADDSGDGDDTGDPSACAGVAAADCAARADCATLDGRPLQDDGAGGVCVDFSEPGQALGCMNADGGCGDAETLGAAPDDPGTCWWFPSTCLPTGWTACDWVDYGECRP